MMPAPFPITLLLLAGIALAALAIGQVLRSRNLHIWLGPWLLQRLRGRPPVTGPVHVMFCFVDHFEPMWNDADPATQAARVDRWCRDYRSMASRHRDADGVHPQHSFFYPEEEYTVEHLDKLAALCADGFGEIEVHLHHDNDTEANFRQTITRFCNTLHQRHGALPLDPATGKPVFGFIHGNWCLDNCRADGRWCGINNELVLLRELGCYADFTLPSAPSETQTRRTNAIYYAKDDPQRPKSHDDGVPVCVGGAPSGDLLIVQGPLSLHSRGGLRFWMPRIENADIRQQQPPSPARTDAWIKAGIHVEGRPEWIFVKIHTHGTQEQDMDTLLGPAMDAMHADLEARYNDGVRHVLHYVSAREAYNIIKAAEDGKQGNPNDYRDYRLAPPPSSRVGAGRVAVDGAMP